MVLRLVLFGAPGAGKGTQASFLKKHFGIKHISTGDIFREAMRNKTALGHEAQRYIEAGLLVPDEVVIGLVQAALNDEVGEQGFVFDGFPRTVPQAEMFEQMLAQTSRPLNGVVSLEVAEDLLVRRISGRRLCPLCGSLYHVDYLGDRAICPKDGTGLEQRKDDAEDAVKTRLLAFARQTLPLKEYYRQRSLLKEIDGSGAPDVVSERLLDVVLQLQGEVA